MKIVGGILFFSGLAWRKNLPRYPHFHSVVTKLSTWCSTLGFYEVPLSGTWDILSLALVYWNIDKITYFQLTIKSFVEGILYFGSLACWNNLPREKHWQSVVTNIPTRSSKLEVSEGPLGDHCILLSLSQVYCYTECF